MSKPHQYAWTCALLSAMVLPFEASGGGFDRFGQDVSLLFDPGNIVIDVTTQYTTSPHHYFAVDGQRERVAIADDYVRGAGRVKITLDPTIDCLGSLAVPFGTSIDYGRAWSHARDVVAQHFDVIEWGMTCSVKFETTLGRFRGVGGVTADVIEYTQTAVRTPTTISRLEFEGMTSSWRAGVGWENPAAGTVVNMVYNAPISFELSGRISQFPLPNAAVLSTVPFRGAVTVPQSVEFTVFQALPAGWNVGVFAKWMNWSRLDHVPLFATESVPPVTPGIRVSDLRTFFTDGWTLALSSGRQLDDKWSIKTQIAWDKGVSTGWTSHTDIWALSGTIQYRLDDHTEIRAGATIGWLTPSEITQGSYRASLAGDYVLVPQIGLRKRY